ncbi:hypothetical protein [Botrimarina mediterranea]|uniref:Lipoprotein n=1 Tax=Botrimarina mediterranea TaxID=2528022 RepID=A0A518KES1_9BACT|nr:hypothetical protein [Botrimarina mediterranea]QDV76289.1 hypothetical protein Spa11_45190 [Botrimarina mediterranea]QDV80887.1 hypothetical protein K2D_45220 [Planctomycetes bacterium K2D]
MNRITLLPLLALPLLLLPGCADGPVKPDPEVVKSLRERYALETEPADAVTPLDWREQREAVDSEEEDEAAEEATPITLVGTVGGMPNPWGADNEPDFPWKKGQATFFLVDPSTVEEFASHAAAEGVEHAEDCPFCSREARNKTSSVAVVTFPSTEDPEQPAAVDARDLFKLEKGDLVVVHGQWTLKGDVLMVSADGLYKRE